MGLSNSSNDGLDRIVETIHKMTEANSKPSDFESSGMIYPIISRQGGVLKRAGHPEAIMDLVEIALMYPAGLTVEMIKKNGTLYSINEIKEIAQQKNGQL